MAGKKEEGSGKEGEHEVWAVEVVEALGLKGNLETLAVAVQDRGTVTVTVDIKLVNVTTMVPCGLGGSLPVSQVDAKTVKAHELRVFKALVAPLLGTTAGKKAQPKYIPVRKDKREDGLRQVAEKIKAHRFYIPAKKGSTLLEKLVLEMPGGCTLLGVGGGKVLASLTAATVDVFDSHAQSQQQEDADDKSGSNSSISYFDDSTSEYSSSMLGASGRMTMSMPTSSRAGCYASDAGSMEFTRRSITVNNDGSIEMANPSAMALPSPQIGRTVTMPAGAEGLSPYPFFHLLRDGGHSHSAQFPLLMSQSAGLESGGQTPLSGHAGMMTPEQESLSGQFYLQVARTQGEQALLSQLSAPIMRRSYTFSDNSAQDSQQFAIHEHEQPIAESYASSPSLSGESPSSHASDGTKTPRRKSTGQGTPKGRERDAKVGAFGRMFSQFGSVKEKSLSKDPPQLDKALSREASVPSRSIRRGLGAGFGSGKGL